MATYLINTLQNEIGTRRRPGLRQRIGMSIALIGAILLVGETLAWFARALTDAPMRQALAGGMLGAAATALGALPLLWARPFGTRAQGRLLALAAGIMLAASAFSLLLPSLDAGRALWGGNVAAAVTAASLLLGAALVLLLERALPHAERDAAGGEAPALGAHTRGQIWLFVAAVTLHNIPEGLAMGVGAASGSHALSFGIAAQDSPKGMAIAVALLGAGYAP
ncbi:MAG: ZIP family metal transporter, partial [Candidatus Accumulibacter sp.]|nr:ZIP family metal transporter [Accumulibacter sp.]